MNDDCLLTSERAARAFQSLSLEEWGALLNSGRLDDFLRWPDFPVKFASVPKGDSPLN